MVVRRRRQPWYVEGGLELAAFLSLVVVVVGFLTEVPAWTAAGVVVGGLGLVSPLVLMGMPRPATTKLVVALTIVAVDLALLVLMWVTT